MNEKMPPLESIPVLHERAIQESENQRNTLAESLTQSPEAFPYPGLDEAAYAKLKAESDEFPGFTTHIDDLVTRFKAEGICIVVTKGTNVFVMPWGCDPQSPKDIEENSVPLKHFNVTGDMDERMKNLIYSLHALDLS